MKRKIFSILFALVLLTSLSLVTAVPAAADPGDGDVTIVVQDQAGSPIEGATARLLFYGGGKGGYSMDGKITDATGSATFTAAEIATWLAAEGYDPSSQIYAQPGAKVETDNAYGKVRTVDPEDGFPCIPYNTPDGGLVVKPAMSFTYKMIMMSTEPVQVVWDDPSNEFTVTATLAGSLSVVPDETQMRLIRNLVGGQPPAVGGSDDDWYMWNGTAYERWKGIATVSATATGASVSASFSQDIFSDWLVGNKIVVRPEFGVNRTVDGVPCIDDYNAVDILRPSSYIHPVQIDDTTLFYPTIQDAIDAADPLDTISVAAGVYDEQVAIGKALTLQGAGDATVIKPSGPELTPTADIPWIGGGTGKMSAIVEVSTAGGVVTVRDLKIDAAFVTSKSTTWVAGLVYLETGGKVEGVSVIGNTSLPDRTAGIFAAAITESASLEVTGCTVIGYNRAGIYALGATFVADYHHNEINGPGALSGGVPNGIFFLRGATGSATYNVVTDLAYTGETYLSTGIGTYNAGAGILFAHNDVSSVQNAFALSNNTVGTVIEYNEVYGCQTGVRIESGATASVIQYNDIHDNHYAIRCDEAMGVSNVAHSNNFVNNAGPYDREGYEGAVCNLHPAVFDASKNWWGNASGPDGAQVFTGPETYTGLLAGTGDSVSANVKCMPWLTRPFGTVLKDNIAYFGVSFPALKGWNIVSAPLALDAHVAVTVGTTTYPANTWGGLLHLGKIAVDDDYALKLYYTENVTTGERTYAPIYYYDSDPASGVNFGWRQATNLTEINPVDAFYIRMMASDSIPILFSPDLSVPSKKLYHGWNLVGCAYMDVMFADDLPLKTALATIAEVSSPAGDVKGYAQVVSPPVNQPSWIFIPPETYIPSEVVVGTILMGKGYWVFMENPGTLAGLTFTPISLGPK